jgi:hypothetical protein
MPLNESRVRQFLKEFKFSDLFIQELGWDRHSASLKIQLDGKTFTLEPAAEKRGFAVFTCAPLSNGQIPPYPVRRKIDAQVTKYAREHLIIFVDEGKTTQVWQWVKRELGKPSACREISYHANQSGEALIQKLRALLVTLEEEERISLPDVVRRSQTAFDVERVTKRFYDRFKTEHDGFFKFIDGIPEEELHRWYASVMLNRLMFIYFIQKKNFLNQDMNYLKTKLLESQKQGQDLFYSKFLRVLFFEGFAKQEKERSREVNALLGKIPYLNGGLFLPHQIEEQYGRSIKIADSAFEKLFEFFDQYQWHLDERPLRNDNEINPDVLGYIFEKYINQKQMGAYYTKEDITGYISRNTIIPRLFDIAKQKRRIAFEGEQSVWKLLQSDPDRYIYDAVKHGITVNARSIPPTPLGKPYPLPPEIEGGIKEIPKRTEWNKPAPPEFALPTEIWREVVARRQRYEEVRQKLASGEIRDINDLITYNLNIQQFAQDVIENCEGPDLLRAFWHAIEKITILDPTCGSGAFLFAALNILESLYEACLNRMQVFVDELEHSSEKHRPEKFKDFKETLKRVDQHPNEKYFIYKSITVNNLYGVDIMEEAVEICKLRLFLKLVAQVDRVEDIEPLPDIDFNIRAGNTLVGFVKLEEVKQAVESLVKASETIMQAWSLNPKLEDVKRAIELQSMYNQKSGTRENQQKFLINSLKQIEEKAELADRAFQMFHQLQTKQGMEAKDFAKAKEEVRSRLDNLAEELNRYLASEYGIRSSVFSEKQYEEKFAHWLVSHKPFHWFTEFYGIMKNGGFDVIIGNPPYVEYSKVKGDYTVKGYATEECGNLYAFVVERSLPLLLKRGQFGMIIPISLACSERMSPLRRVMWNSSPAMWISNFAIRPQPLFAEIMQRNSIILISPNQGAPVINSTRYLRWYAAERDHLFECLAYANITHITGELSIVPKVSANVGVTILDSIKENSTRRVVSILDNAGPPLYFHDSGESYWTKTLWEKPIAYRNGRVVEPAQWFALPIKDEDKADVYLLLNSNLFYLLWTVYTDCRHMTKGFVESVPLPVAPIRSKELRTQLQRAYKENTILFEKRPGYKSPEITVHNFKPLIDEIDRVLAQHYRFTDEELDFVINYDIKYRMGQDSTAEDEE